MRNVTSDYELRVLGMLNYGLMFLMAISLTQKVGKSFHTVPIDHDFLYPMSYVYDPTNTKTKTKEEI